MSFLPLARSCVQCIVRNHILAIFNAFGNAVFNISDRDTFGSNQDSSALCIPPNDTGMICRVPDIGTVPNVCLPCLDGT